MTAGRERFVRVLYPHRGREGRTTLGGRKQEEKFFVLLLQKHSAPLCHSRSREEVKKFTIFVQRAETKRRSRGGGVCLSRSPEGAVGDLIEELRRSARDGRVKSKLNGGGGDEEV